MKKIYTFLALTAGLMFAATACVNISENNDIYRQPGTPIAFSASSGYQNGVETKAEYSGYYYGSPSYERIDWVANDPVKIVYNGTPASYTVATVSGTTSEISDATLGSGNLTWDGSNTHVFYGLYPAGATGSSGTLTNAGQVSGSIPAVQDINASKTITDQDNITKYQPDTEHYGYLVAFKEIAASSTESTVVLPFRPAVTTFEFKFQRLSADTYPNNIQSFTLSTQAVGSNPTTPLSGDFQFQITGGDSKGATWNNVTTSSTGNSITVGFGAGGVAIPSTGYLDFSILALPTDITGATMTVTYVGGATKSLKLKTNGGNDWYTFTGAKKYVITNTVPGDEVWHYVIEEIDDITTYGHDPQTNLSFNVRSYKYSDRNPSTKIEVPWKLKCSTDDGSTWNDVASDGTTGSGSAHSITNDNGSSGDPIVTGTGVNSSTYSTGEPREANILGQAASNQSSTNTVQAIRADLRTRSPRGTESNPWDLSKHDIFGDSHNMTTANSYVVDRPGWYMFPCVYGNAISNAQINWEAFRPGDPNHSSISNIYSTYESNGNVRYYYEFFDAANAPISHPYIANNYSNNGGTCTISGAEIVWQNSMTGDAIMTTSPSTTDINPGAPGLGTVKYIKFQIKPEDIQPGNIVIAIKGKVDNLDNATNWYSNLPDGTILWSWQIWVTQADLTPVTVDTDVAFMPRNLGAVDKTDAAVTQWADRRIKYRVVQVDDNGNERIIGIHTGAEEDFIVEEIGDAESVEANIGNNPFYQWGRKDPMVPVDPLGVPTQTGPGHNDGHVTDHIVPGTGYSDFDTAIEVSGITKTVNGTTVIYDNVMEGIQNPHRLCRNSYLRYPESPGYTYPTWIGGPDYAALTVGGYNYTRRGSFPYNLWNATVFMSADFGGNNKWKTVYDPCPPGFCVPSLNAVSTFTSVTSRTNDGATVAGLFFPYTGLRAYHPGSIDTQMIGNSSYIWVDVPHDGDDGTNILTAFHFGRGFVVSRDNILNPVTLGYHEGDVTYTRGSAFSIRPMVDPKYAPSSSPSPTASMGGGSIPNVGNGGEIPSN